MLTLLLAAPLLFAALPVAAHHPSSGIISAHWFVTLSTTSITRGLGGIIAVTQNVCCDANCNAIYNSGRRDRRANAYFDISTTSVTGIMLSTAPAAEFPELPGWLE